MKWWHLAFGALAIGSCGCSSNNDDPAAAPPVAEPLNLGELSITENPSNALSVYVAWTSDRPASTRLTVRCGTDYEAEFSSAALTTNHEVFVMGLYENAECALQAESVAESGDVGRAAGAMTVSALPEFLPRFTLWIAEVDQLRPGWTLFNLSNQIDMQPLVVAIIDEKSRYRWYYQRPGLNSGDATELKIVSDGILIGGGGAVPASRASWEGEQLWESDLLLQHHDLTPLDGERLLYTGIDFGCPEFAGDSVVIWDEATATLEKFWSHCEHYRPIPWRSDWSHLNTVVPFPDEKTVLISSRNENALFKVNLETDQIEWMLGTPPTPYEPADLPRMQFVEGEPFYLQHAPEPSADLRSITLFDNGAAPERPYSRVIEMSIDEEKLEARVVKEYRPENDIFTQLWGDADKLDNGNILSVWGARNIVPSRIIEFAPSGETIWFVDVPPKWGVYRADRVTDPLLGYVVDN